jgi:hypothetical protein
MGNLNLKEGVRCSTLGGTRIDHPFHKENWTELQTIKRQKFPFQSFGPIPFPQFTASMPFQKTSFAPQIILDNPTKNEYSSIKGAINPNDRRNRPQNPEDSSR